MLRKKDIIAQGFTDSHDDTCGYDIYTDGGYRRALVVPDTGEVRLTYRVNVGKYDWGW